MFLTPQSNYQTNPFPQQNHPKLTSPNHTLPGNETKRPQTKFPKRKSRKKIFPHERSISRHTPQKNDYWLLNFWLRASGSWLLNSYLSTTLTKELCSFPMNEEK
ncbi:hypothetical protein D4L85_15050 [Chryseolinea soli]|uniref:Uncharacterized protein n=1 Tax=Chryseolinea soli TaxID=2321403 RepID=A0A385SLW0_9BACT|nr:hypothetical protein D4L85_15050 [Chryseolinea soli]